MLRLHKNRVLLGTVVIIVCAVMAFWMAEAFSGRPSTLSVMRMAEQQLDQATSIREDERIELLTRLGRIGDAWAEISESEPYLHTQQVCAMIAAAPSDSRLLPDKTELLKVSRIRSMAHLDGSVVIRLLNYGDRTRAVELFLQILPTEGLEVGYATICLNLLRHQIQDGDTVSAGITYERFLSHARHHLQKPNVLFIACQQYAQLARIAKANGIASVLISLPENVVLAKPDPELRPIPQYRAEYCLAMASILMTCGDTKRAREFVHFATNDLSLQLRVVEGNAASDPDFIHKVAREIALLRARAAAILDDAVDSGSERLMDQVLAVVNEVDAADRESFLGDCAESMARHSWTSRSQQLVASIQSHDAKRSIPIEIARLLFENGELQSANMLLSEVKHQMPSELSLRERAYVLVAIAEASEDGVDRTAAAAALHAMVDSNQVGLNKSDEDLFFLKACELRAFDVAWTMLNRQNSTMRRPDALVRLALAMHASDLRSE